MITVVTLEVCACILLKFALILGSRSCSSSDVTDLPCAETEACDLQTNSCLCLPGLNRINVTYCSQTTIYSAKNYSSAVDNHSSRSVFVSIFIPLFLVIICVICGIYINKKYKIIWWFRNKINRSNSSYDEFMIGRDLQDDDPPLN